MEREGKKKGGESMGGKGPGGEGRGGGKSKEKKIALSRELFFPFNMVYGFAYIINILLMRIPIGEEESDFP